MPDVTTDVAKTLTDLHTELQYFYARQMQVLDDGDAVAWAQTFTENGTFEANAHPTPTTGRTALAEAARHTHAELRADNVVRRHWIGMLVADPQPDGTVHARSYATVLATRKGGTTTVHCSTVCDDVLVPSEGSWLVDRRVVVRDDLS